MMLQEYTNAIESTPLFTPAYAHRAAAYLKLKQHMKVLEVSGNLHSEYILTANLAFPFAHA